MVTVFHRWKGEKVCSWADNEDNTTSSNDTDTNPNLRAVTERSQAQQLAKQLAADAKTFNDTITAAGFDSISVNKIELPQIVAKGQGLRSVSALSWGDGDSTGSFAGFSPWSGKSCERKWFTCAATRSVIFGEN